MGGGNTAQYKRSKEIDKTIKQAHRGVYITILLLGCTNSGKSTLFRQLKIVANRGGLSPQELMDARPDLLSNSWCAMRALVLNADRLGIAFSDEHSQVACMLLKLHHKEVVWTKELVDGILRLWNDPGIQKVYEMRAIFHIRSSKHLITNLPHFINPSYTPTHMDWLKMSPNLTGIEEVSFRFEDLRMTVTNLNSDHRKWMETFQSVSGLLFCVSLTSYREKALEDPSTSRMAQSLQLFSEAANSPYFSNALLILIFTKMDLLATSLETYPLQNYFTDYCQPDNTDNVENAVCFIKSLFVSKTPPDRSPTVHFLSNLNTKLVQNCIVSIRHLMLTNFPKN